MNVNRRDVLGKLQDHELELKAAGIAHLRLFGSVARDEASADSDVDLVADFDPTRRYTLLSMSHLENRLADILGVKVDLAPSESLKKAVRHGVIRDAIVVF